MYEGDSSRCFSSDDHTNQVANKARLSSRMTSTVHVVKQGDLSCSPPFYHNRQCLALELIRYSHSEKVYVALFTSDLIWINRHISKVVAGIASPSEPRRRREAALVYGRLIRIDWNSNEVQSRQNRYCSKLRRRLFSAFATRMYCTRGIVMVRR